MGRIPPIAVGAVVIVALVIIALTLESDFYERSIANDNDKAEGSNTPRNIQTEQMAGNRQTRITTNTDIQQQKPVNLPKMERLVRKRAQPRANTFLSNRQTKITTNTDIQQQQPVNLPKMERLVRIKVQPTISLETRKKLVFGAEDIEREELKQNAWLGIDQLVLYEKWPGLMLDGRYILRDFIDPSDTRAFVMGNHPSNINDMSEADAEERFYQLVTENHLQCFERRRIGNLWEGGWDMCVSAPYKPGDDCIVYSFGINNDFTFDDAMGNIFGCTVLSFDPSMNVGHHRRSEKVYFYSIGLGNVNTVNEQGWKMLTLDSIFEQNGHSDKIIDYLKLDIEESEWPAFEVMAERNTLKNVKQLSFEIHTVEMHGPGHNSDKFQFFNWYNILLGLEKQGFRKYYNHFNPYGRYQSMHTGKERTCCYELYYVNVNFLKQS